MVILLCLVLCRGMFLLPSLAACPALALWIMAGLCVFRGVVPLIVVL